MHPKDKDSANCSLFSESADLARIAEEHVFFQRVLVAFPGIVILKSALPESSGKILIWNAAAESFTGVPASEALGTLLDSNLNPQPAAGLSGADLDAMSRGTPITSEMVRRGRADAAQEVLRITRTPIFDSDSQPVALLLMAEASSRTPQKSNELRADRSVLEALLENAPLGIVAKSLRPATVGQYFIWNLAMEKIFGIPASDVIGRRSSKIFEPEIATLFEAEDQAAIASSDKVEHGPTAVQTPHGERLLRSFKMCINDSDGSPLALIGTIEDVTESGRIAHKLRENESRWQMAIAAADAGVWDWNSQSGEIFLSDHLRELTGLPLDFHCRNPKDLESLVHPDDLPALRGALEQHLRKSNDVFRVEFRLNTTSDEESWLVLNGKAQLNESGEVERAIGTVTDVTPVKVAQKEMAEAKESAEAANRAKGNFLAMMSHEIRTPLNGVLGFADLLAESKLNDQQRDFLQTIRDSGGALLAIINDILDYSKIEAGKLDVDLKPTDIRQILQSTVSFFHPQADKKGIELRLQIHSSTPTMVLCDPVRVRQIVLNLMGNALKFTSRGFVELDLSATPAANPNTSNVRIYIKDSGIGISSGDQQRLFEPFNQLDASTSRKFGGTGLGLSIVKRLAELMGGGVQVESAVGQGTTFSVTLPCEHAEKDYDPRNTMLIQLDITPDFARSRPLRILVAEDNLVNRKLARLLLQKFGYSPDEAEDGSRAVSMALEHEYDLILMDIQMPGMDGYEATQKIREMCPYPTQVVALTAHALKSDEERSRQQGMDGHLSKPIRADLLRKVLERAARARMLRSQRQS